MISEGYLKDENQDINRVSIVGAGTMGYTIAHRCALFGKETCLFDASPDALKRALKLIDEMLKEQIENTSLSPDEARKVLSRIHPCDDLQTCVSDAQLVIEVVPENLALKRQVFSQIDQYAPQETILATTSSSISCSKIADATQRPGKVLNLHFSPPDEGIPVEIMGNPETFPEVKNMAENLIQSLEMIPIRVSGEIMGFGLNTIWHEIKKAALKVVAGGHLHFEDIDRWWLISLKTPSGIFHMMDIVGLDVVRDIELQYYEASGDERDRPPEFLDRLIAQGRMGVKSGRGFYTYPDSEFLQPGWLGKKPPWTSEMDINLDL